MKTINFNEKPKISSEKAAYLVDIENVDIMRQYVAKHYPGNAFTNDTWTDWFDNVIGNSVKRYPSEKYTLYFHDSEIYWDTEVYAYQHEYNIYYIRPNVIPMSLG